MRWSGEDSEQKGVLSPRRQGDFPGRSKRTLATKGEFIHSFDKSIIQTTHTFIDQAFELKKQVT